jgi:hypothetical protein
MSFKRKLALKLPRAMGVAAASMLLFGLVGASSCSKYPTFKGIGPDCTTESPYEFYVKPSNVTDQGDGDLTLSRAGDWFASPDYSPDGGAAVDDAGRSYVASMQAPTDEAIPGQPAGGLCNEYTKAMVFRASHNNDWGGLFGDWSFGKTNAQDASAWEGISFWGRSPGETTKGFTFVLDDDNTTSPSAGVDGGDLPVYTNCTSYTTDGGTNSSGGGPSGIDPSTGVALSGGNTTRAPYANECGNSYVAIKEVTSAWTFYTIPFSAFQQDFKPNRVPNSAFQAGDVPDTGLLTSKLRHPTIRMPRGAEGELWLAHLAFYRAKAPKDDAAPAEDVVRRDVVQSDRAPSDPPPKDLPSVDMSSVDGLQIDATALDGSESDGPSGGQSIDALEIDVAQD